MEKSNEIHIDKDNLARAKRGDFAASFDNMTETGETASLLLRRGYGVFQQPEGPVLFAAEEREEYSSHIQSEIDAGRPVRRVDWENFSRKVQDVDPQGIYDESANGLHERLTDLSALAGFRIWQTAFVGLVMAVLVAGFIVQPLLTLYVVLGTMIVIMASLVVFRLGLLGGGIAWNLNRFIEDGPEAVPDADLPRYTIMLPLLREREQTLRGLVKSMEHVDYPKDRLQVLVIMEITDLETRGVIEAMDLPEWFSTVIIPDADPHTKGKACNYALHFATGDYVTIYDAEDHPDPNQLRKAVAKFASSGPELVCVQSQLNFYNYDENWLTRMYTLDYSAWYYFLLPGMETLSFPICLGGSSNHFKTSAIREICAWDPYNVTEDADLGLRIARKGWKTVLIDSVTMEEANTRISTFIRQRTRWMKGYMLTYMVHMRNPFRTLLELGPWKFLGMQLFVAGNFLNNLIILPLLVSTAVYFANEIFPFSEQELFPAKLLLAGTFSFVIGNVAAIALYIAAAFRRGHKGLAIFAFTAPVYWLLCMIGTYRGLWQVIFNPFQWEKTDHGLSQLEVSEEAILLEGERAA